MKSRSKEATFISHQDPPGIPTPYAPAWCFSQAQAGGVVRSARGDCVAVDERCMVANARLKRLSGWGPLSRFLKLADGGWVFESKNGRQIMREAKRRRALSAVTGAIRRPSVAGLVKVRSTCAGTTRWWVTRMWRFVPPPPTRTRLRPIRGEKTRFARRGQGLESTPATALLLTRPGLST